MNGSLFSYNVTLRTNIIFVSNNCFRRGRNYFFLQRIKYAADDIKLAFWLGNSWNLLDQCTRFVCVSSEDLVSEFLLGDKLPVLPV